VGQELLRIDIDNLNAAVAGLDVNRLFMPSSGPSGFGDNRYYADRGGLRAGRRRSDARGYLGIVEAGFIVQIDDPWLSDASRTLRSRSASARRRRPCTWRSSTTHFAAFLSRRSVTTRATPEPRPAAHRHRLKDAMKFAFTITRRLSFEVMNPRHMHEWRQLEGIGVPDGPS